MKSFNKIKQLWADTGGHKGAAILARGFYEPVIFAEAATKHARIKRHFPSTGGSFHGLSPEADRIMTQKTSRGNDNYLWTEDWSTMPREGLGGFYLEVKIGQLND